jgi:hypothetical protein
MTTQPESTVDDLYGPGAADTFKTGHVISLTLSDGMERTATVVKGFTPFTLSQVLLVDAHDCPGVVSPVVIKIYDPRFIKSRKRLSTESFPWSLELEVTVAERRNAIVRGDHEDDFDEYVFKNAVFFEENLYRAANEAF